MGKIDFGYKLVAGCSRELVSCTPEECPICKEGNMPLDKPGSRKLVID
ncbi:MAG TPA: hypothetical protein VK087_01865 [Tissierellaceae bacterium]|nr:hypothetical protein [Tissierellaceae bacterium]